MILSLLGSILTASQHDDDYKDSLNELLIFVTEHRNLTSATRLVGLEPRRHARNALQRSRF